MKICTKCNIKKNIKDYYKSKRHRDGLQKCCKECHSQYNKKIYTNDKQRFIKRASKKNKENITWWKIFKESLHCIVCEESRTWCLEFHHRDPSIKEANMRTLIGSKHKFQKELDKCDVLCRNCHADTHYRASLVQR